MKNGINLLPELEEESEQLKKFKRLLRIFTPVVLIVYGVILAGTLIYWNIQNVSASDVNAKISGVEKAISDQKETESLFRGSQSKLLGVSQILKEHVNYSQVIARIEDILPADMSLTSLAVKEDGTVDISLQAPNSAILTESINALLDQNRGGKYFEHARLTSLVLARDGSYLFSLNFHIRQN
ncbi:MAG: hypothetical protein M1120_01610 [Patescibacteria group bacterium]|nr:hypothetical protein [Patescibacteria group bacterium]